MAKQQRKTIDLIFILLGSIATIVLLVIGGLAWWGYSFATTTVKNELTAQKIHFPPAGSPALDPQKYPDLQQYAGQLVNDGPKAKAYANGFIGRHLEEVADGKTYAEVSSEALKDPTNQELQKQKQALFQGETLRGILIGNGYAYWTFGMIAKYVALASFLGAGIMAYLVWLGIFHLSRLK
jgi:hypothetical protein